MKKLGLSFYYITLLLICQCVPLVALSAWAEETPSAPALSEAQKTAIVANCTAIKDNLQKLQKDDSHARVYLGGRFEKINSKFVIPLNVRLVENSLSTPELVENQNQLTSSKATFVNDFVDYQRELETLVGQDCQVEPEKFYAQLQKVRAKRQTVADDVAKTRSLAGEHATLVTTLKEKSDA